MSKKTKKNGSHKMEAALVGASIAGLAAAAYFYFGPKGKVNQKHTKAWAIKMKADVIDKLEKAREVSEPTYKEIVDSVALEYAKGKKASGTEIKTLAQDLKKHWKTISAGARVAKSDVKKIAKKVAKTAKR